jgi:hypothetical protein
MDGDVACKRRQPHYRAVRCFGESLATVLYSCPNPFSRSYWEIILGKP